MAGFPGTDPLADQTSVSDADLISLVTQGDQDALAALYERYSRAVYSFSLRIVGDAQVAEEILQEVFVRAWQQGGSFQSSRGTLITWLLSITHNLSIDEVRRRKRRPQKAESEQPESILATLPDDGLEVEEEVWLSSLRVSIQDALQQLPAAQREAIELAYFQGLTQREIADTLGEPLGTIKTRMRLGMLKLREQLGPLVSERSDPNEVNLS
ncbi:MAG: sigma-70 family RNA polymerase sigma factor [Thermomicrobiales bacterium]